LAKRQGLYCARCHKRIRKGENIVITTFAHYGGLAEDGRPLVDPWLSVPAHLSHGGGLNAEAIQAARRLRLTAE
jgi:hypothetical protein